MGVIEASATRFTFDGVTPITDANLLPRLDAIVTLDDVTDYLGLFSDESMDDQVRGYTIFSAMQIQSYLNQAVFRQTVRDYYKCVSPQYRLTAIPMANADVVWTAVRDDYSVFSNTVQPVEFSQHVFDNGDSFDYVHRSAYQEVSQLKLNSYIQNPINIVYQTECEMKLRAAVKQAILWYSNLCFQSRGEIMEGINDRHIKTILSPYKSPIAVQRVTELKRRPNGSYYHAVN